MRFSNTIILCEFRSKKKIILLVLTMDIYVLFGQTATGKTARALDLVKEQGGEIVNFDSRQIYKKLDIVTGKDTPLDPTIKIWLYDIVDPKESFSSAEYVEMAKKIIENILKRGKTPILVGGTGYYLSHLLYGVPETGAGENWDLRQKLNGKTVSELQCMLKEKDSLQFDSMNNSDRNNPRRLTRRIELLDAGAILSPPPVRDLKGRAFGATLHLIPFFHSSTEKVREAIEKRVEARIQIGAIEEVKKLLGEGYTEKDPGLNAIGYKQLISYVKGEKSLDDAKKEWITKEVQYAKRQKTYFKKFFPV